MKRVYIDTETCGLHGQPVILQYAIEDGPVQIYEFWHEPIGKTLDLLSWLCQNCIVGFNLTFDWFHINKIYNTLDALNDEHAIPLNHIDELGEVESGARDGKCLKPASALDLFLYAKKTDLQITMERSDVIIRRVPEILAQELADLLNKKIRLDPILFAGRKKKNAPIFVVRDVKQDDGTVHPHLRNVCLKFRPSSSLKNIVEHKLGIKVTRFDEIQIDKKFLPKEYGYAPFALAVGNSKTGWNGAWPEVIEQHIGHWRHNKLARQYSIDDVVNTRRLDEMWGYPEHGDYNSTLSCAVAATRWKGFATDNDKLDKLIVDWKEKLKVPTAGGPCKEYLKQGMNPIEALAIDRSTAKKVLKDIVETYKEERPDIAKRAQAVLDSRKAKKKIEVLIKLQKAGRFHVSNKIVGALSDRMSGADGLNAQGIDKTKEVRECFPLSFDAEQALNGDMQSFEIGIADAVYDDPKLREQLLTCEKCGAQVDIDNRGNKKCPECGCNKTKSFHGLFGLSFWPNMTYEEILATQGTPVPLYNYAKNAAFATIYGAQAAKLKDTLNISDEELVSEGLLRFWRTYKVAGDKRKKTEMEFVSLYSERVGGAIRWKEPRQEISSLLGWKRYFNLENYLIKVLFEVAEKPPERWNQFKTKIIRSKRGDQFVGGAVRSALYGAAFALQNASVRQAQNHEIQSTGAGVVKRVQCAIWEFQPVGIHEWYVRTTNVHDELPTVCKPELSEKIINRVYEKVEEFRPMIPLIGIDYDKVTSWAE